MKSDDKKLRPGRKEMDKVVVREKEFGKKIKDEKMRKMIQIISYIHMLCPSNPC